MLGNTVVDNLFSGGDAVGQVIRIRNLPFKVVGRLSVMVGVVFGYYPAHKAASLDPIDALRYE